MLLYWLLLIRTIIKMYPNLEDRYTILLKDETLSMSELNGVIDSVSLIQRRVLITRRVMEAIKWLNL
jgi:hypothetical protein